MDRRKATWSGRTILVISLLSLVTISFPYGWIAFIILLTLTVYQLLLRVIFTGPKKRSPPFSDPAWNLLTTKNGTEEVIGFINYAQIKTDLVVFIHGWQSSSERFTERMWIFRNRGFHTLAIDMRGHGQAPYTAEWTVGKVIQDTIAILEKVERENIRKIHFYGHSLGGFVSIGMHHDRYNGWWKDMYGTLMLESPMTAYSPILEQTTRKFSFMWPILRRIALHGFSKVHPEIGKLEWKDIDMPNWGLPQIPILLLQAKNDTKLGRFHYDLIMKQNLDVENHLIESLPHSSNRVNEERDKIILSWIKTKMI